MKTPLKLSASVAALLVGGCALVAPPTQTKPAAALPAPVADATPSRPLDPGLLQPPAQPFTLGPGDKLEIEIAGDVTTRTLTLVGPDGKIYYQVLPGLDVWGLTLAQTRAALEKSLASLYRESPQVTVTLREVASKQVWLLDRLTAPGLYPLKGPMTLLEALSRAGGPAPTPVFASLTLGGAATFAGGSDEAADLRNAFVVREGRVLPVNFLRLLRAGDMSQNIYLQPDDLVYLPSAVSQEVYVLGAVGQPKAVSYTERTTLMAAIAGAGGTIKDAYLSHVAVVRGGVGAPHLTVLDYKDIVLGKATDFALEANDIVYVPLAPYRTVTRYLDLILSTFARTVGVNAGARVATHGQAVGISVPVGP
ncbi:MAG: SLBB domain-containing protein [Opitutae bacterium]|nr:SLBB domain-containing protein [Opitutae bacterium]